MKTTKQFVAALAATSLALAACSGGSGTESPESKTGGDQNNSQDQEKKDVKAFDFNETPYDEVSDGGTLTTALADLTEQANPFHEDASLYTTRQWYWYNPQLAMFTGDGEWSFNPDYFDDVTTSEVDGNTVVTYKVKEEAKFNDDTPIDVEAFKATWEANKSNDGEYHPSATDGYSRIKSVEAGSSNKEVVVTFDGIYAWWQGLFNMVMHPAMADPKVYNEGFIKTVHPEWGAGPYKVENVDFQKGEATFVRNEKWWGKPGKLDKRVFREMENQASLNAFKNGEIDATEVASEERYTAVKDMSGITIREGLYPSNALLMLNSSVPALSDPNVRHAVMSAVDRSILASITFQGLDYTEPAPGSFLQFSTQPGYHDNFSEAVSFDPAESQKLLAEAGYADSDGDGIVEKDGKALQLNMPVLGDSKATKDRASALQSMLKTVGIDLQIEERPSSDFSNIYTNREFDIFTLGFTSTDPFGVAYFDQVYSQNSGLNLSGTGTAEFDKKIAELAKIGDPEEQTAKANELEVEAFKLYGIMPLYNGPQMVAVKDGLANYGAYGFAEFGTPVQNVGWVK